MSNPELIPDLTKIDQSGMNKYSKKIKPKEIKELMEA